MGFATYLKVLCVGAIVAASQFALGEEPAKPLRAGIIGLDTSHVVEFTKAFNNPKASGELAQVKVVAAFPGGSPDLPESWNRVKEYTATVRGMDVEIVDSIDELLKRVDVVLLESIDGRPHLAQAKLVIAAGKPLFVDKPMAASLADVIQIFRLAKEKNVPVFSASSLRYVTAYQALRNGTSDLGEVRNCMTFGPFTVEPHHPDLFWYGVHGVESLFTIMGPGCKVVTRVAPDKTVGIWSDGRMGIYSGEKRKEKSYSALYAALVDGTKAGGRVGKYEGYDPLLVEIVKFFKTGKPPVSAEETIQIFAFMEAADESKRQGGQPVTIESVMKKAEAQAALDGR